MLYWAGTSKIRKFKDKWITKIKKVCFVKDYVKRMKRQAIDLEKIFARNISDKGLLSQV